MQFYTNKCNEGETLTPGPNECNSTLTSETRDINLGMDHYFLLGGYHFWDLQTIFLKSNAFQTIFLQPFLKNVTGFFIDLI